MSLDRPDLGLHDHDTHHDHDGHDHDGHDHDGHDHDGHDHDGHDHGPPAAVALWTRTQALARARLLNRLSLGWNVGEAVIALWAGLVAGSVSLVGFGMDSGIEVAAAVIVAWRLHQERRQGCMQSYDRTATRLIAMAFGALAAYVLVQAVADLASEARPEASPVGLALAVVSLSLMPWLARAKRALAPALGSQAVAADADQTNLCALLSAVLLVGVGLNALFGWWWADPVAGLGISFLAAVAGVKAWRADSLDHTCCG